jgi:hypothetical protein
MDSVAPLSILRPDPNDMMHHEDPHYQFALCR